MDPRMKDAVRQMPVLIKNFEERLLSMEEKQTEMLKLLRAVKKATVRSYNKRK